MVKNKYLHIIVPVKSITFDVVMDKISAILRGFFGLAPVVFIQTVRSFARRIIYDGVYRKADIWRKYYKEEDTMKEPVKLLTFVYIAFIILLAASGSVGAVFSEILYFAAFLLPTLIAYKSSLEFKHRREEIAGVSEPPDRLLTLDKASIGHILPIIAPVIALVIGMAYLTSLALGLFGFSSDPVPDTSLLEMLVFSALVPALLEEMLFRYLPMKLILPYSPRWCIILSAAYFALSHNDFFKMPYAFLAGIIFMGIDVMTGSVWPSIIMHFANNVASIIWMRYCTSNRAIWIYILILTTLVVISLVFIIKNRKKYKSLIKEKCRAGEPFPPTLAPLALCIITVFLAVMKLVR